MGELADQWAEMSQLTTNKPFEQIEVALSNKDYTTAQKFFTLKNKTLHKVCRIQNQSLYFAYTAEKRKLENQYSEESIFELQLYHGTDVKTLPKINANGFNRSYSRKHATLYGEGTYFAREMRLSTFYSKAEPSTGYQFIYLALVLVGRFCKGNPEMKNLPDQPNGLPYDSAVDNMKNPSHLVIFHDSHAYPLYLYEFS